MAPGTPNAVLNVGTAINTAGTAMLETVGIGAFSAVNSDGSTQNGGQGNLECRGNARLVFGTTTYTQNATPTTGSNSGVVPATAIVLPTANWAYAGARGKMTLSFTGSTTTTGQTMYGTGIVPNTGTTYLNFDVFFTTPQTAPNGLFVPQAVLSALWNRILSN
jgi:hypothetical protein